jgi:hypothetical protein
LALVVPQILPYSVDDGGEPKENTPLFGTWLFHLFILTPGSQTSSHSKQFLPELGRIYALSIKTFYSPPLTCHPVPQTKGWKWENWMEDSFGSFTTQSLRLMIESMTSSQFNSIYEWNNWIPLPVNFLGWRTSLNRLPSLVALQQRGVSIPFIVCLMCSLPR